MAQPLEPDASKRSIENQPSETALGAAFIRALSANDSRDEIRGADNLAELFLDEYRKNIVHDPAAREHVVKNKLVPGIYGFITARTAFFDHIVEQALKSNIPQIVFLGAGYDSRPYRFKKLLRDTKIFEVDAPPTQQRKREILQQEGISIPDKLAFVPTNFDMDNLQDTLFKTKLLRNQRALFIWEGVTYYLNTPAVDKVLAVIKSNTATGSSVCFDFSSIPVEAQDKNNARELRNHMRSLHPSEPTKFGIPEGKLESFLLERGYKVIEHLGPQEIEEKYLKLRDNSTLKVPPASLHFAHAVTA